MSAGAFDETIFVGYNISEIFHIVDFFVCVYYMFVLNIIVKLEYVVRYEQEISFYIYIFVPRFNLNIIPYRCKFFCFLYREIVQLASSYSIKI